MKVKDILLQKGTSVQSIDLESTVYDALTLMAYKNIGALLVTTGNTLIGIFTERDYARKIILKGKGSKDTMVVDVMNKNPVTVSEDMDIELCMNLMTNKYVRHLPVMRNDEIVGIISIGDVVKSVISEQQFIIENLDNYISGTKTLV